MEVLCYGAGNGEELAGFLFGSRAYRLGLQHTLRSTKVRRVRGHEFVKDTLLTYLEFDFLWKRNISKFRDSGVRSHDSPTNTLGILLAYVG